jgi:hypothetical protein
MQMHFAWRVTTVALWIALQPGGANTRCKKNEMRDNMQYELPLSTLQRRRNKGGSHPYVFSFSCALVPSAARSPLLHGCLRRKSENRSVASSSARAAASTLVNVPSLGRSNTIPTLWWRKQQSIRQGARVDRKDGRTSARRLLFLVMLMAGTTAEGEVVPCLLVIHGIKRQQ